MGMEDREWKMNEKFDEFTTCRGVFEHTKKKRNLAHFSNQQYEIHFAPKYMADYAFGKC